MRAKYTKKLRSKKLRSKKQRKTRRCVRSRRSYQRGG